MNRRFRTAVIKTALGRMFALIFLAISISLVGLAGFQFFSDLAEDKELVNIFVQLVNTMIISLAISELGIGIFKEYGNQDDEAANTFAVLRRTVARFVGTVSIALVLESLIMIIKYSQLDLAGNLNYPVAILVGASILLISLGLFLHFSRPDCKGP